MRKKWDFTGKIARITRSYIAVFYLDQTIYYVFYGIVHIDEKIQGWYLLNYFIG